MVFQFLLLSIVVIWYLCHYFAQNVWKFQLNNQPLACNFISKCHDTLFHFGLIYIWFKICFLPLTFHGIHVVFICCLYIIARNMCFFVRKFTGFHSSRLGFMSSCSLCAMFILLQISYLHWVGGLMVNLTAVGVKNVGFKPVIPHFEVENFGIGMVGPPLPF